MVWTSIGLMGILIIYFLPWRYQVNDDIILDWLLSGIYTGTPEAYVIFIHPLWSGFLAFLFKNFNTTPWYSIQHFLVLGGSCYLGIQSIEFQSDQWKQRLLATLVLSISWHISLMPQFTLVSGWAAATAIMYLGFGSKKPWETRFAWLLFAIAAMIRLESAGLIALGFGVVTFGLSRGMVKIKQFTAFGLIILGLALSQKIWENQSEFKAFLKFNQARAKVLDHPVFYEDWLDGKFNYDSKWSSFSNWFIEKSGISLEDLSEKSKELNARQLSLSEVNRSFSRLIRIQKEEAFKGVISATLLILFALNYRFFTLKTWLATGLWIVFLLVFNHFFHVKGRVLFLFFLPILIPLFQILKSSNQIRGALFFTVILSLLFVYHLINFAQEAKERKELLVQLKTLMTGSGTLTKLEGYPLEYLSQVDIQGEKINLLLDGWVARSPFQRRALNRLGYHDFRDIREYNLLGIKKFAPFFFSDYMNSFGNRYDLVGTKETEDLIIYHYRILDSSN